MHSEPSVNRTLNQKPGPTMVPKMSRKVDPKPDPLWGDQVLDALSNHFTCFGFFDISVGSSFVIVLDTFWVQYRATRLSELSTSLLNLIRRSFKLIISFIYPRSNSPGIIHFRETWERA